MSGLRLIQYRTDDGHQRSTVACPTHREVIYADVASRRVEGTRSVTAPDIARCDECEGAPAATGGYWYVSKPMHGWSCDCDDESGHIEQREWIPTPSAEPQAEGGA